MTNVSGTSCPLAFREDAAEGEVNGCGMEHWE